MILHSAGADRFRDLANDDAYRSWLISRNQPPIVHHSGQMYWKRLCVIARHIAAFIASQRVALVAARIRHPRRRPVFGRYDDKRTADRGRP